MEYDWNMYQLWPYSLSSFYSYLLEHSLHAVREPRHRKAHVVDYWDPQLIISPNLPAKARTNFLSVKSIPLKGDSAV